MVFIGSIDEKFTFVYNSGFWVWRNLKVAVSLLCHKIFIFSDVCMEVDSGFFRVTIHARYITNMVSCPGKRTPDQGSLNWLFW